MPGSFQNEIPAARINLKLDVGKGDAKKKVELPMKLLVTGDFSQQEKDGRLADREKININKDNFTQVMESMDLKLKYMVDNKITDEGSIGIDLDMKNIDSFKPENIAKDVPEISRLLAARNLLKDLKSNLLDNREFRKRLEEIVKDSGSAQELYEQLKQIVPEGPKEEESSEEK